MELVCAAVLLTAGLTETLLLSADVLAAPAARHSPSSALPSGQSLGGSPGRSTGTQMRRLLLSLLLAALVAGELAILAETLLSSAADSLRLPEPLFSALRLAPVSRSPSLPLAPHREQTLVLTSALTSLVVYWAALTNAISGPPLFASLRVWLLSNGLLYALFVASAFCAGLWGSALPLYVLLSSAQTLTLLGLTYYGGSIVRMMQSIPSAGKVVLRRLTFLVRPPASPNLA